MDAHNESAVAELPPEVTSPAINELPDPVEPGSFADAIESALSSLETTPEPAEVAPEPEPEVAPEPEVEAEPEPEPEPVAKKTAKKKTAKKTETAETEPESGDLEQESDPIEALTEDIGEDWTPKAASRFKELKTELKTNRSELDSLRQTVKEQEAKMREMSGLANSEEVDQLKEKLANYEKEQMFTNLEETDAYKEAVANPLADILSKVGGIADKYEVDSEALIDAVALPDAEKQDEALAPLLDGASDRDRATIYRAIEDMGPILKRRSELIENSAEALKEAELLAEQRKNAEAAEKAELRTNVTRNVVRRVTEKLPFLNGLDGVDFDSIETKASDLDPSIIHPVDFAYNSVAAQLLPTIVRQFMESRKENDSLMDRLAEYEDAEPTMSGTPNSDKSGPSGDLSFTDAIEAALN